MYSNLKNQVFIIVISGFVILPFRFSYAEGSGNLRNESGDLTSEEIIVSPHSLNDVLDEIERNHPVLQSGRLKKNAGKSSYKSALLLYPDPELTIQKKDLESDKLNFYPDTGIQKTSSSGMEVKVSQAFPFPGKLTLETHRAKIQYRIEELRYLISRNRVAGDFLTALSETLRLKKTLEITRNFSSQVRILADIAESRYRTGKGNLSDVSRAKLRASGYDEKVAELEGLYKAKREELHYFLDYNTARKDGDVTNRDDLLENMVRDDKEIENLTSQIILVNDKVKDDLELRSLELKLALLQEELRGKNETLSKMAYLPDFSIFASYGRNKLSGDYTQVSKTTENSYTLGVTIRVPIWSALANYHKIRENDQLTHSAKLDRDDISKQISRAFSATSYEFHSTSERMGLYRRILVPQADLSLRSSRLAYETGRVDFSTLLESFDGLYLARVELVRLESLHRIQAFQLAFILDTLYSTPERKESEYETPQ